MYITPLLFFLTSNLPYYSEGDLPSILAPFESEMDMYKEYLAIGAVAFILFNILRYYGAKIFSDEQGVTQAKAEIIDSVAVALLLFGLILMLDIVEYVSQLAYPSYFSEGPKDMFDSYIIPTIYKTMKSAASDAKKHATEAADKYKSLSISLSIFAYPIPLRGGSSYTAIKSANSLILRSQIETSIAVGLSVAYAAVNYIKDAAGYFLIIGVIARIFPFFRGAGAFLISLGIGFYYIYPLVTAMFLFGIPQLSFDESTYKSIDQAFCKMKATGALILPDQNLASGFSVDLGNPQSVEQDFGLIVSTEFLLSQLVALSLTAMFINNFTLLLGKGIYVGSNITSALNRLV